MEGINDRDTMLQCLGATNFEHLIEIAKDLRIPKI